MSPSSGGRPTAAELDATYQRLQAVPAVARELGVAYETARQWLLEAGVKLRAKGRPSLRAEHLDVDQIIKRYNSGESIAALGAAMSVSPTTVRKRLTDAGVALRPRRGWKY
jgi:hypothetical protein